MTIGIIDAVKLMDGTTEDLAEISTKYNVSPGEAFKQSMRTAVIIMKAAIPKKPDKCKEEDGKIHWFCPACTADISDWQDGWDFCPCCGQAVSMPEEE